MQYPVITRMYSFFPILLFVAAIFSAHPALAATYYVATTGSDSNPGTQSQPFRTIQKAANTVQAGDTVLIRGGTYSQPTINFSRSGAAGKLITWRAEPGTGQVWIRHSSSLKLYNTAIINMFAVSYNRIEGLGFGGPNGSLADQGIKPFATNNPDHITTISNVRGNQFVNNTFQNIGHDGSGGSAFFGAIHMNGGYDNLIEGNAFTGIWGHSVVDYAGYQNIHRNNRISNIKPAVHYGDDWYPLNGHGIWLAGGSTWTPGSNTRRAGYHLVENNVVDGTATNNEASGIRCDAGGHNLTIRRNIVRNLSHSRSSGIYIESRCANNLITENVVVGSNLNYDTSSPWISYTRYNTWKNNVSYRGKIGFAFRRVSNSLIVNNIAIEASHIQVLATENAVGQSNVWRYNLWWRSANGNIAYWNCTETKESSPCIHGSNSNQANLTLSHWMNASGDSNSLSTNPLFVSLTSGSEDFHLQLSSPAIGKGEGGVDMGAYPNGSSSSAPSSGLPAPTGLSVNLH